MKILAIGAHPDDIEIGCGGTLLHLKDTHNAEIHTYLMTYGGASHYGCERRVGEQSRANEILGISGFRCAGLADTRLDDYDLISMIEEVIAELSPDYIFTHYGIDTHQDHRAIAQATVSACRNCSKLLFYESISSENFQPTLLVDIESHLETKCDAVAAHKMQDIHLGLTGYVTTLAQHRAYRTGLRYVEAFATRKFIWKC